MLHEKGFVFGDSPSKIEVIGALGIQEGMGRIRCVTHTAKGQGALPPSELKQISMCFFSLSMPSAVEFCFENSTLVSGMKFQTHIFCCTMSHWLLCLNTFPTHPGGDWHHGSTDRTELKPWCCSRKAEAALHDYAHSMYWHKWGRSDEREHKT